MNSFVSGLKSFLLNNCLIKIVCFVLECNMERSFCLQMALCLVSMTFVACYIYRFLLVSDMLEYMRSSFFEHFVSLAFITLWDEVREQCTFILLNVTS